MNFYVTENVINSDGIDLTSSSSQVQSLFTLDTAYQLEVLRLFNSTSDNPSGVELKKRGYGYLLNLFQNMPLRSRAHGKLMSMEFRNLVFFCRYVGPRPTAKHSLHRLNNEVGYQVGNVEWADKRKQAEVRSTTQPHVHLGRRLTDRALADLINSQGKKVTGAAIKKARQRLKAKGRSANEITRIILEKHGLPYSSSHDPVEAWDFPSKVSVKLNKLYPNFRRSHETRLHYFIRWLEESIERLTTILDTPNLYDQYQKDECHDTIKQYKWTLRDMKAELLERMQESAARVLEEAKAGLCYPVY